MASQRQLAANRRNAKKSTGPKTPEGRAAVRFNGLKHGLSTETLLLPGESEADFTHLLNSLEDEHQPATPAEEALVRELATATWRLQRLYHFEARFLASRLEQLPGADNRRYPSLGASGRLALVAHGDAGGRTISNLSRIEARLAGSFDRALRALRHLRAHRGVKMQNQTQSQIRTPAAEPIPAPSTPKADQGVGCGPGGPPHKIIRNQPRTDDQTISNPRYSVSMPPSDAAQMWTSPFG
jgi:hypothetical protein